MRTKKFAKKLALNKSTVANLNHGQMSGLKGGGWDTKITCPFCNSIDSCEETLCTICMSIPETFCDCV